MKKIFTCSLVCLFAVIVCFGLAGCSGWNRDSKGYYVVMKNLPNYRIDRNGFTEIRDGKNLYQSSSSGQTLYYNGYQYRNIGDGWQKGKDPDGRDFKIDTYILAQMSSFCELTESMRFFRKFPESKKQNGTNIYLEREVTVWYSDKQTQTGSQRREEYFVDTKYDVVLAHYQWVDDALDSSFEVIMFEVGGQDLSSYINQVK